MMAGVTGAKDSTKSGCCFAKPFTYSRHFAPMNFSKVPEKFRRGRVPRGIGDANLPFPLWIQKLVEIFGCLAGFDQFGIEENTDWQQPPRRNQRVFFLKLLGKSFRRRRNIASEQSLFFHQEHDVPT